MILTKLRFKNFFSSGNAFVEIDLTKYKRSVISGKNGEGKSTVLSAITFAGFGKTIKQVTKSQIINTINNKNCLVELEGVKGSKTFLVRRGIKPNIFEIYENDVLVDQTLVGEYQTYLEEKLFGCSFRTFLQTSVISIENYKPFMTLTAAERRSFIEDILDIKVFSAMSTMVKSDNTKNKENLRIIDIEFKTLKEKIQTLKSHIEQMENIASESTDAIDADIKRVEEELKTAADSVITAQDALDNTKPRTIELNAMVKVLRGYERQSEDLKRSIAKEKKSLEFFDNHDDCPTCQQALKGGKIEEIRSTHNAQIAAYQSELNILVKNISEFKDFDDQQSSHEDDVSECENKVTRLNVTINHLKAQLIKLGKDKVKAETLVDLTEQKATLKELARSAVKVRDRQTELNTEQDYNAMMIELLKDSGIKSKIVDQYIPIINKLVNEYLERLDFFVSFNLDSEFNEVIKSRHRDAFSYNSFSMGERQRIDLAMMFTMRRIAAMKSSFECNMLCADEVLDAAVDADGVSLINDILMSPEFDKTNLFVISHRNTDLFQDLFDGKYYAKKRDGFSEIHEINE